MTPDQVRKLARESTMTNVGTASHAHGFGANLGYQKIRDGTFPCRVIRAGRKLLVPTADLLASLGLSAD